MHERTNECGLKAEARFCLPGDACLGVFPMFHISGLVLNLHLNLFCGITLVVCPSFNFQKMLESVVRHKITHLYFVPPLVVMLVNNSITKDYDLSHVRFAMVGAAPFSKDVTKQFKAMFPHMRIGQGYGLTETALVSKFLYQEESANGSAGHLLPDTTAHIVKPDGSLADYGEPGELWLKGPQMALGYLNDEKANEETFLPDGWLRTGDEALVTKAGDLFITDRVKEILKVNGFQVAPAELEGQLIVHPSVVDAGVVGIPDPLTGETPLAFVVLEPSVAERVRASVADTERVRAELQKWVADNKVRYKHLDGGVVFVDAIPKNPSGKILRRILREQAKEIVRKRAEKGTAEQP